MLALNAMSFLPRLSAIFPQTGAITALITKDAEKTMPDQRCTSAACTPNSLVR